jgi:hypothetical protein
MFQLTNLYTPQKRQCNSPEGRKRIETETAKLVAKGGDRPTVGGGGILTHSEMQILFHH